MHSLEHFFGSFIDVVNFIDIMAVSGLGVVNLGAGAGRAGANLSGAAIQRTGNVGIGAMGAAPSQILPVLRAHRDRTTYGYPWPYSVQQQTPPDF